MFKRRTTHPRRRPRSKVLEVRVMSPRIAWLGLLGFGASLLKLAAILAVFGGIGWGIWQGVQRAFYHNPDFLLQVIDLNPNPVVDEVELAEIIGINPTPNLFAIDPEALSLQLKAMPAIADARAERHLPGKLVVRVTARTPRAWISCTDADPSGIRKAGALLVDTGGIAYPCPKLGLDRALKLPIIRIPASEKFPVAAGQKISHPDLTHSLRLLDSACQADPEAVNWINSIQQVNEWSLLLVTRQGSAATFGLGDHERQIHSLRAAMDHSSQRGYQIDTINLIPKHNIPITVRDEVVAPRAIPVVEADTVQADENSRPAERRTAPRSH
jgi:hypothetical protein